MWSAGEGCGRVWEIGLTSTTKLQKALQLGCTGVWRDALTSRTPAYGMDRRFSELLLTERAA